MVHIVNHPFRFAEEFKQLQGLVRPACQGFQRPVFQNNRKLVVKKLLESRLHLFHQQFSVLRFFYRFIISFKTADIVYIPGDRICYMQVAQHSLLIAGVQSD